MSLMGIKITTRNIAPLEHLKTPHRQNT